jgi:hypothetical protein
MGSSLFSLDCGGSTPLSFFCCGVLGARPMPLAISERQPPRFQAKEEKKESGVEPPQSKATHHP